MTREVQGERFFHINRQLPYSLHPPLTEGQQIVVGAEENPFFRFFRRNIRNFPVDLPDGSTQLVPAMTFLRHVRDGNITPHNLPRDAWQIADHFVILARELLLELVRSSEFPEAPSRWRGIWLVKDLTALALWRDRLQREGVQAQFFEVVATGRAHECDAAHILGDSESFDESECKAREYWSGKMATQGSEPEVLFDGELSVVRLLNSTEF